MTRRTVMALLVPAFPVILHGGEGYAIVTKKTNTRPITKAQLKKLMLGQGASWQGGGKITLILGPVGDAARAAALKDIADMTESGFNKNLIHMNFVGQSDNAPMTLPSLAAVRQIVQLNDKGVSSRRIW